MTRARDVANVLTAASNLATDTETAAAISTHAALSDPHAGYLKESEFSAAGKNYVINGGMDVWQRGTSLTGITAGNTFLADRWSVGTAGAYNVYLSRQLTGDLTNLPHIQYCLRYGRTVGDTNGNWNVLNTSFETINSIPLAGKTVTLSFYARAGANFSSSGKGLASFVMSGTGIDQNLTLAYTGAIYSYGGHTLTSNWQRFTNTYLVPTNSTEVAISFQYVPTGTAIINDYYEITGVQLEVGTTPTAFSRAGGTIAGELAACQRYFVRYAQNSAIGNTMYFASGNAISTTRAMVSIPVPVNLRTVPSLTKTSGVALYNQGSNYYWNTSVGPFSNMYQSSQNILNLDCWVPSGLTNNTPVMVALVNANDYLDFSAEL